MVAAGLSCGLTGTLLLESQTYAFASARILCDWYHAFLTFCLERCINRSITTLPSLCCLPVGTGAWVL